MYVYKVASWMTTYFVAAKDMNSAVTKAKKAFHTDGQTGVFDVRLVERLGELVQ